MKIETGGCELVDIPDWLSDIVVFEHKLCIRDNTVWTLNGKLSASFNWGTTRLTYDYWDIIYIIGQDHVDTLELTEDIIDLYPEIFIDKPLGVFLKKLK